MGEKAYKAIKLFKILIIFLLIGSILTIGLSSYLFYDKGVEQRIAEDLSFSEDTGNELPNMGVICSIGIVLLVFGIIFIGLVIAISVFMIQSRKEDPRLESDGMVGGILVLCTFATGFISNLPYLGLLSGMAQTGLMFGGLMIFIRKLLPEKYRRINILAFTILMSGSFISTVGRFYAEFMTDTGIDHIMAALASIVIIAGYITYLRILNKDDGLPPRPIRRENIYRPYPQANPDTYQSSIP